LVLNNESRARQRVKPSEAEPVSDDQIGTSGAAQPTAEARKAALKSETGRRIGAESDGLEQQVFETPSRMLMHLAVVCTVAGVIGAFLLAGGGSYTPIVSVCLAFFAGGLAVWRLFADDKVRDAGAIAVREARIRRLMQRCEELEDRTWELRESDERNASILSALGDIVVRRDDENSVVYANMAAAKAFGADQAPVLGEPLRLPVIGDGDKAREKASEHGIAFGDLHLQTVDGPRWFSRIDVSVRDTISDQPLTQTVLRDVTERRLIEEELLAARQSAESSNEAKSRFLATVSHEIRTPLNGVLGMAALLRDTRLTREQIAYIEALETSGETLLMLIDEVLDFSKVEAGKLEIQAAPVRLAPLVESVVELLAPKAQAKGLEIGARFHPSLPDTVTLDASRVRQILFNLAGNGIKFTDEGGVAIRIDGRPNPDGGSFLEFSVMDTGIGFDKAEADRLFREFEQVDHGPARKFGGTGLGLAIAQRLTRLMGGSIEAISEKSKGAVFKVVVPVPEELVFRDTAVASSVAGKSIVIVSASGLEGALLRERLEFEGAEVALRRPGSADLTEHMAAADLVMIDNGSVADSGGWLVSARLAGCQAPAVVMIAPPERDRLERLREAGFAAYLIRPVRTETLSQVISGLLEESGPDQHLWEAGAEAHSGDLEALRGRTPVRPLRLLVAEDNDINRLLSEALLRKLGHEPTVVTDGEKAVEAAASTEFDAVLMDLHMPGLDGIGAIRKIREQEQQGGRPPVPILMVTADVMRDAREKAAKEGAAGYLTKPLSADALCDALVRLKV
jgi:PAS domain S-box-containing protein